MIVAIALLLAFAAISEAALSFATQELTQEASRKHMASSIATTVEKALANLDDEAAFTLVSEDSSGKIVSIRTDAAALNLFKASLTESLQKRINGNIRIGVPVGSFTNIAVLNGRGFPVPLRLSVQSSANISFDSQMVSAGINQSCHRITMTVSVQAVSQSRRFTADTSYETEFVLSETVIVGEVPQLVAGRLE